MAAPPTIPPPPSESTTTTGTKPSVPPPPPPPSSAPESVPLPKKLELEEAGFHHSPYYNIRAAVANLRGRFIQVCQAAQPQKKDAAREILEEIKVLMELSKKTRLDLSAAAGPVNPMDKPVARAGNNKTTGKILSGEKIQVPLTDHSAFILPNAGEKVPLNSVSLLTAAKRLLMEIQREAKPSDLTNNSKQPDQQCVQGSYVIGGSLTGWNFLMWPGSKAVYYGLTKSEWLARQAAK